MSEYLVNIQNERLSFFTPAGEVKALNDVSLHLKEGEVLGIVGESGSGKSVTAYSLMGLTAYPGRLIGGDVYKRQTLYIVATPIGNLGDLTPRAAKTFEEVDFIAAEDTRVTLKLLNHLGIKKPLVSYYEHNLKERGEYILNRIAAGENCALCSDAGMPAVSDPGEVIVRDAHARGIPVCPVPAASAAVTALCVSGQVTGRFVFEGFLPTNRRQKKDRLDQLKDEQRTMIFYEAPHKLPTTLRDFLEDVYKRQVHDQLPVERRRAGSPYAG